MRAAVAFILIAAACLMLKRAIDRGFKFDETYGDAARTVGIIVLAVLLVEEGLILLNAIRWIVD